MLQRQNPSFARAHRSVVKPQAVIGFATAQELHRMEKKQKLLDLIQPLKRGVLATSADKAVIDRAARELEELNPTEQPLASPLANGKWELLYTTSSSILGTNRPPFLRPSGPIYQIIDAVNGRGRNMETAPLFNQVTANLTPLSDSKVAVKFQQFKLLGLIPITAPDRARGELEFTYLDEDLRVSRGDKGNLFVLRMVDRNAKP